MKIRRRKTRRFVYKNEVIAGLVIIITALLILFGIKAALDTEPSVITLSVEDAEIRQDEELPDIQVKTTLEEDILDVKLSENGDYTIGDLVSELSEGKGYTIDSDVDTAEEGEYPISLKLDEELQEKLSSEWSEKLEIIIIEGTLTIKSKYGDWEGNKFKLLEEGYAIGWMDIANHTYYFNEDGEYVTGENEIEGRTYYFGDDGTFDEEKNPINPNHPMIALTFDDGPSIYTDTILNALEENGAKATFFMLGTRVEQYNDEVERMMDIGCELASHTTNHKDLTKLSASDIRAEVKAASKAIKKVSGKAPELVRPPYGAINSSVRKNAKAPLILWSLDTLDWESKDAKKVKKEVLSTIKDGDIVLMHDIYKSTAEAVVDLVPELIDEGYQLLTVSELAEFRGVKLEDGEKYTSFRK